MMKLKLPIIIMLLFLMACSANEEPTENTTQAPTKTDKSIELTLDEANRLADLPLGCIQNPLPYKSGIVIEKEEDLAMPIVHHPAFYGCFDWHSAVHGHWSLVYLLKTFPDLAKRDAAMEMIDKNLTKANIEQEIAYFSMNSQSASFERTYGWAWLLKLQEELYTWDNPKAKEWYKNLEPLADYIAKAYISYLPKLVYPIRVGEHSNTAFGLSFAYDYAQTVGNTKLEKLIKESAIRFYNNDKNCPISWEPSGYDFLSPCLQELDIMRKVLNDEEFAQWSKAFLPELFEQKMTLEPGKVLDRSDGKLVHLDGLNFSRAWCLYSLKDNTNAYNIATEHLDYSLSKITDGDYAGQHWLASFALYAFKAKN
ncbi:MAG: DUF2891 domain-containing protein [Saprospiraceae bacterium]